MSFKNSVAASEVEDEGPPMIEIDEEELLMMASDPVEEAIQAKLERERVRRRAERARIAKAELEEAERLEAERIANIPPPPILAKRLEFKFPKNCKGIKPMNKGIRIEAKTNAPGTALMNVAIKCEEYAIDDFPEDADDIPGTIEIIAPPVVDV